MPVLECDMEQTLADSIDEELWFGIDDSEAADQAAAESLAASVARITGLKPFPDVARQLMVVLDSSDWDIRKVAQLMSSDPSLAGLVLRVANSTFYGGGRKSGDIREAVMKIGGAKLRELVIGIATLNLLGGRGRKARLVRDHCAATAALAKIIAGVVGEVPGDLFLAGLLHDAGKILLMDSGDFDYKNDPTSHDENPCSENLPPREREALGFDHAVLGGHVLRAWGIPEPVPRLVAWHHQPVRAWEEGGQVAQQLAILRLADRLSSTLDEPWDHAMLADTTDAQWAGVERATLQRMDRMLRAASEEALSIFHV